MPTMDEIPEEVDYIFQGGADGIFQTAGVDPKRYPALYKEVKEILAHKMALLSASMGLSYERVRLYNEQKEALVTDLLNLKLEGKIEGINE